MNWLILFLIAAFAYILFASVRENFQNTQPTSDTSCQQDAMQESITQNSDNITSLQNQVGSLQSLMNDISGNLSSLTDQVNTMQSQQASIVSATTPSNITGTD